MTTACPHAPRDEKNTENKQQTDPRGEGKKEKQHKLHTKIRNALYFGLKHQRFSNRIHPRIVKL